MEISKEKLVPCYNCNGKKRFWQNGVPHLGCVLCKAMGDGKGQMNPKVRLEKSVKVEGLTFYAPPFSCVFCEDSGMVTEKVWIKELIKDSYSDKGWCIMPYKTFRCTKCPKGTAE